MLPDFRAHPVIPLQIIHTHGLENENENKEGLRAIIYEGEMNGDCVTEQQLFMGHRKLVAVCNS